MVSTERTGLIGNIECDIVCCLVEVSAQCNIMILDECGIEHIIHPVEIGIFFRPSVLFIKINFAISITAGLSRIFLCLVEETHVLGRIGNNIKHLGRCMYCKSARILCCKVFSGC